MLQITPKQRAALSRAYWAGAKPSELAKDYGTTTANVIMIAKRWEQKRMESRPRQKPGPKPRQAIDPTPPIVPEFISLSYLTASGIRAFTGKVAKAYSLGFSGGSVAEQITQVSLPYVSFLYGPMTTQERG
jgi:transposase